MRKGNSFLIFILVFSFISIFALADTGTYKIVDYSVKLTPHSNGIVEMDYYQKWLVTGGHIPWITVGTANSSYQIDQKKNRGNIRSIQSYNSSGWSGVRIDLDKDYLPGETLEVGFSLLQSRLFYADEENYRLDFTPGWYDRAETERLSITAHFFTPLGQVKTSPNPTRLEGQEITWEKLNLRKGERFTISFSFPKTYLPQASESTLKSRSREGRFPGVAVCIPWVFILFIILIIIIGIIKGARYGRGGSISAGGAGGGRAGRSTGGGGGFGGRSSSCACACVSCACACACAGGGGAGCTKKTSHSCSVCRQGKKDHL